VRYTPCVTTRPSDPPADDLAAAYRPIARTTTTDQVVDRIERLIVERQLGENETLPSERELAAMLGVSRNILREGLSILGQKGLVETVPGRRTRVGRPGLRQLRSTVDLMVRVGDVSLAELNEVRLIVEPEIAFRAAANATAEGVRELGATLETLEARRLEPAGHVEADVAFHRQVAQLAGNALLVMLLDAVSEPLMRSMALGTGIPRAIEEGDRYHRAVYEAIKRRDPPGAMAAMQEHMDYVRSYVTGFEFEPGSPGAEPSPPRA